MYINIRVFISTDIVLFVVNITWFVSVLQNSDNLDFVKILVSCMLSLLKLCWNNQDTLSMNKEIVINPNHKLKYISFSFNRYIILQLLEIFFTIFIPKFAYKDISRNIKVL